MLNTIRDWFGFGGFEQVHASHDHAGAPGHTHGVIDPSISSSERGIWAIKWSFAILAITATLQIIVVFRSGSVALLADTIHNIGDATTAIPLWFAFVLARRKPSKTFTYGLGRVEDLAGLVIVLIILFSAGVAGYEAISRLINPHPVTQLGWLAVAGFIGFLGNEIVAVFRIRVGRQMNSAALIADGYHARTDGLTSLAVVVGAAGVWLGFPLADPVIGLLITIAILGIVWQSSRAVITRMLDGVEPSVVEDIRHAAAHVPGIKKVADVKARWLGHELHADVTIAVNNDQSLVEAKGIAAAMQRELHAHMPALAVANVWIEMDEAAAIAPAPEHHHAAEPIRVSGALASGLLEIVHTAQGERMRLTVSEPSTRLKAVVVIARDGGSETLPLLPLGRNRSNPQYQSAVSPAEPHEFDAVLQMEMGERRESFPFRMTEPEGDNH